MADSPVVKRDTCTDFRRSSRLEWLETNGTGGYAMGTVSGTNTRRYHGLLVAALRPPVERSVILSKLEEELEMDGAAVELGANQYPGAVHPQGFQHLVEFDSIPSPQWRYEAAGNHVEKRLFMVAGEQTVVVQYRASRPCRLHVRPFLAFRDYHSLTYANPTLDGGVRRERPATLRIRPYAALPELRFHHSGGEFHAEGCWYCNLEYLEELDRGLEFREDLYCPGVLSFDLGPEQPVYIVATLEDGEYDGARVAELERARRAAAPADRTPVARLDAAAEQFCVRRADGLPTVIAGYPWFTDWGRDTMIALPGLFLARGRVEEARQVISGFLEHLDGGLIPNRFPDRAERPEYNTVDATLWMFVAAQAYRAAGGDAAFLRDVFYPAGREIIACHCAGTHHDIRMDPRDGLLSAGSGAAQLTWMDAKVGDWVVTPRHGKPVEINALWLHALRRMAEWAAEFGDRDGAREYARLAHQAEGSFERAFWNPERQCLYDVLTPSGPDASLRPNQILAVSLPSPPLPPARQKAVVRTVQEHLLTPYGLRTLAPGDAAYRGRYGGNPVERDGAYHQGTVWPWLLGPFVSAYLQAFGRTPENAAYCRGLLEPLLVDLDRGCLGSLNEIYDGDAPHGPQGAPAQAWSVAELLRVLRFELSQPD